MNPTSGGASQRWARARPIERSLPAASSSTSALDRALAGIRRQCERRAGPGRTVGEQGQQRGLIAIDQWHQHDDFTAVARHQRVAGRAGLDVCRRRDERAQAADLDTQALLVLRVCVLATAAFGQMLPASG